MAQVNVISKLFFLDSKYAVALSGVINKKENDGYSNYYGGIYIRIIENRDAKNPLFSSYLPDQAVHMLAAGLLWNGQSSYVFNDTSRYIEMSAEESPSIVIGQPGGISIAIRSTATALSGLASTMLSMMAAIDDKIALLHIKESNAAKRQS